MEEDTNTTSKYSFLLRRLLRKIAILERVLPVENVSFELLTSVRGFKEISYVKLDNDLFNEGVFNALKSYHVRRFLNDISSLKSCTELELQSLKEKWEIREDVFEVLLSEGLLKWDNGRYVLKNSVSQLFEMLIAHFLKVEFGIDSLINVKLKNLKRGGDVDILGKYKTNLLMIEVKESPPNNISLTELKLLIERYKIIDPDLFILVIDTTLSIKRNILDHLYSILKKEPEMLRVSVYKVSENAYVVTAKRDLFSNIKFVILKEFFL